MTDWDARFIALAHHVAGWSKDPSTKVGAVAVDELRRVVGLGYNGFPRGVEDSPERLGDRPVKYRLIVHAEINAVLNAPLGVRGCTLYLTLAPCADCAKAIIQAGVTRVHIDQEAPERWAHDCDQACRMLQEAGVAVGFTPR